MGVDRVGVTARVSSHGKDLALRAARTFTASNRRNSRQEEFMRTRPFSLAALCIALLFLALPAFSQGDRGAITGLITDAGGAVVPSVEVIATDLQTNTTFKGVTTSVGLYRIPYLPPGNYRVTAGMKRSEEHTSELQS